MFGGPRFIPSVTALCFTMVYEVQGKVFLVTGAANGIGAGFVRYAVAENPKHIAILDLAEESGIALQNELNQKYGANKTKFYKVDVTNEDQLFDAYKSVVSEQGQLDVVVNNAGILNDSLNTYKKSIQINVTALITSSFKAYEIMRKDEGGNGGTIINISSIAALHPSSILPVYFATKSAVLQFSQCLSDDDNYSRSGIRVVTVCYGVTDTALYDNMGCFDPKIFATFPEKFKAYPKQKGETASKALLEIYKKAENSEVWLSTSEKPIRNITPEVHQAFGILTKLVFE